MMAKINKQQTNLLKFLLSHQRNTRKMELRLSGVKQIKKEEKMAKYLIDRIEVNNIILKQN